MNINNNDSMTLLSAPLLASLGSTLTIRDNGDLHIIDLTALTCVSDTTVVGNDFSPDDLRDLLLHLFSGC
jgi:hypothetical protein